MGISKAFDTSYKKLTLSNSVDLLVQLNKDLEIFFKKQIKKGRQYKGKLKLVLCHLSPTLSQCSKI